ncbi:endonuclease [Desulfopila inferna]|nr:endonuclease [Desulfopila inferna]
MYHCDVGPSDFERPRNDRVMRIQGNRNPFIDNPGWANLIWQEQVH